ncbi:hypothetical protein ACJJTC_015922 [Scirpophaga incertulas]
MTGLIHDSVHSVPGEGGVECGKDDFRCADGSRCLPKAWRCDERTHCPDFSDEQDCDYANSCDNWQFRCAESGHCITRVWVCDGDRDCGVGDFSDEDPILCNKEFTCPGNKARCVSPVGDRFQCVDIRSFCDGRRDCRDGSDEYDICDNETLLAECKTMSCEVLGVDSGCRPTHQGPACYCPDGYRHQDGLCVDMDECEGTGAQGMGMGPCAQRCRNTPGSYECSCAAGFSLRADNASCAPIEDPSGEKLSFIIVTNQGLRRVWPQTWPPEESNATLFALPTVTKFTLPISTKAPTVTVTDDNKTFLRALNVQPVEVIYDNRSMCYVHHNVSKARIVCVDIDDFSKRWQLDSPTLFPDIEMVNYIRVDWASGAWYFADEARSTLYVCAPSFHPCRMLFTKSVRVRGLALDPARGWLFWSSWGDRGDEPGIERSRLDGESRHNVVSRRVSRPTGLTVDSAARRLCWFDTYFAEIACVDYDGARRVTLARSLPTQHVAQLAVLGGVVVWTEFVRRSVLAVSHPDNSPAKLLELRDFPSSVLIHHRQAQQSLPHQCARDNGGCAHICVSEFRTGSLHARCLCSHGYRRRGHGDCLKIQLESYLVVVRGTPPMVMGLSVEGGTGSLEDGPLEAFPPAAAVTRPSTADVDLRLSWLYYCDTHRSEIIRLRLDGTGREVFLSEGVGNCEGLAVDWMNSNVYWTDQSEGAVLVAREKSPRSARVLVRSRRGGPRSLVLDPARGVMYYTVWAEPGTVVDDANVTHGAAYIQRASMDGSRTSIVAFRGMHWPSGLALHPQRDLLFWCDTFYNKIERLDLAIGKREVFVEDTLNTPLKKPYGLALYEDLVIWSEHDSGMIRARHADGSWTTLYSLPPPVLDVRLVSAAVRSGSNACTHKNGGCEELCLPIDSTDATTIASTATVSNNGRVCACGSPRVLAADGTRCRNATVDELSTCPTGRFLCRGSQHCIPMTHVCDGDEDCEHGEDEDASPKGPCANVTCNTEDNIQCDHNHCLPKSWVCDGYEDCADGSDESAAACSSRAVRCGPEQFQCLRSRRLLARGLALRRRRGLRPARHL